LAETVSLGAWGALVSVKVLVLGVLVLPAASTAVAVTVPLVCGLLELAL
jgi:hypothetical protein